MMTLDSLLFPKKIHITIVVVVAVAVMVTVDIDIIIIVDTELFQDNKHMTF